MKDYLNNSETKELIILNQVSLLVKKFVEGNIMTKEEKADFKRGRTYIKKTIEHMIQRLGESEAKKFVKLYEQSSVIVVSESELKVMMKKKSAELNAVYEENKEYYDLVELTMDGCCKNCTRQGSQCDLCKHFDEQSVPEFNDMKDYGNCKYAYKEDDLYVSGGSKQVLQDIRGNNEASSKEYQREIEPRVKKRKTGKKNRK